MSGKIVRLQPEAYIGRRCHVIASPSHQIHVFIKLVGRHAHRTRETVRHGVMAGDGQSSQSARVRNLGVFLRFSRGVIAKWRVGMCFVKHDFFLEQ